MDKSTSLCSQILILGILICMTTAISTRHKRNVMAEFKWPEPNPDIDHFPHESSCHYYYLVLSQEDITVNQCPDGELFDYIDHKCSRKDSARCWSRHFGKIKHHHIPLKSRGQFRCPYAWGKYPDINNCSKYYLCLSGKVKHKTCAPFEHFDKVSRKCVAAISGVCADKTDVVERDYKCPRAWGSFSFSKDCSKYYECLDRIPSLRTCPPGSLFHPKKRKCLPHIHVHCHSRHNPYGKKEEIVAELSTPPSENPIVTSSNIEFSTEKKTGSDIKASVEVKAGNNGTSETKPKVEDHNLNLQDVNIQKDSVHVSDTTDSSNTNEFIEVPTQKVKSESDVKISSQLVNRNITGQDSKKAEGTVIGNREEIVAESSTPPSENPIVTSSNVEFSTEKKTGSDIKASVEVKAGRNGNSEIESAAKGHNITLQDVNIQKDSVHVSDATDSSNTSEFIEVLTQKVKSSDATDSSNTSEFIEVSTQKVKSESVNQNITGEDSQKTEIVVTGDGGQQGTTESHQATTPEECREEDMTCATEEEGRVVRCPTADGVHPHPADERRFLLCDNSKIHVKFCADKLIFDPKLKKCIGRIVFF